MVASSIQEARIMSNRKTTQAPELRKGISVNRPRPQRGFWDWILGDLWT